MSTESIFAGKHHFEDVDVGGKVILKLMTFYTSMEVKIYIYFFYFDSV